MTDTGLVIKNISKLYNEQRALDKVSFSAEKGEIVGLLGPNGAGKSTLMKILTCFLPPSEGDATVCGHSILGDPMPVRRSIGYLSEKNALYGDMYVREFLRFVAGVHKLPDPRERAEEMIRITGLTPEAGKRINALSKGYRQRVGLAQSLIHDPQVLILDEPTTGLDPNQLEDIRALIRSLGQDKVVLLSTHIMQEVEAMCSRAIIINKGRIVSDQQLSELRPGELTAKFHKVTQ